MRLCQIQAAPARSRTKGRKTSETALAVLYGSLPHSTCLSQAFYNYLLTFPSVHRRLAAIDEATEAAGVVAWADKAVGTDGTALNKDFDWQTSGAEALWANHVSLPSIPIVYADLTSAVIAPAKCCGKKWV